MENNVKELRLNQGLTITELAKKSGLCSKTISNIEKGEETSEVSKRKVVNALKLDYQKAFPDNGGKANE